MGYLISILLSILLWPVDILEPWSVDPPPPGVETAPLDPRQDNFDTPKPLGPVGKVELYGLATYEIEARILSRRRYRLDLTPGWWGTGASPIDLTVGWGPMSDTAMTQHVSFKNFSRMAWATSKIDIFNRDIRSTYANMHMIPITRDVRRQLLALRPNQTVKMTGYLVELRQDGETRMRSSMSRHDGDNLRDCEIMYVTALEVLPPPSAG
ncbi:MAG: hypothetical protein AAF213_02030 [Pseudomonadota bacterium]